MKMSQRLHQARNASINCAILVNAAIVLVGVWYLANLTPNYTAWSTGYGAHFFLSRIIDFTLLLLGCMNAIATTVAWSRLADTPREHRSSAELSAL